MNQFLSRGRSSSFLAVGAFLAFLLCSQPSFSQVIITYAGNGHNGETGDGGPATSAGVVYPEDICLDASGNLYIAGTNKVRKVNAATGVITTVAGNGNYGFSGDGGPATAAAMSFTSGLAVDAAGNLYITEYSGHRIRRVDGTSGIITTIAGTGTAGFSGDNGPAKDAAINTPQSVCVDGAGNVYFADSYNSRVRKIDGATGIITTVAGTGVTSYSGDGGPATRAGVPYPVSVALDTRGNLYIVEVNNSNSCRVRKVEGSTGIITTIAGYSSYAHSGDGGPATAASLFDPSGVCIDREGNVYIAQYDDSRIRRIDAATGVISTLVGTGVHGFSGDCGSPAGAQLYNPKGITVDAAGNLYIADKTNHRVRKVVGGASVSSTTRVSVCANMLPYTWNGLSLSGPGTYTATLQARAVACDSVATLVLTVDSLPTVHRSVKVCDSDLPYRWNGLSLGAPGRYTATIRASSGCDTLATLDLAVNRLDISVSTTNTTCGTATGTATVVASGVAPYSYNWQTSPAQTGATATGLAAGNYTVFITDSIGCVVSAMATVGASALGQQPVVSCTAEVRSCLNSSGRYHIPRLTVSSACGLAGITYKITGATTREGSGDDASGAFNAGVNTITWTVKDIYDNVVSCQTRVDIEDPFTLEIPDVKVLEKGSHVNTVYSGYDRAASLTLQARVAGSSSDYTYLWNTGETTPAISVSPAVASTYSLTVTNSAECSKTVSKSVSVLDVRCANTPKNVMVCQVTSGYPDKEVQICVDPSAVDALLAQGAYLGLCGEPASGLSARVFQNPTHGAFSITVQSPYEGPVELKLVDQYGKVVELRQGITVGSVVRIGGDLQPGIYFLETIQGKLRSTVKLVKL